MIAQEALTDLAKPGQMLSSVAMKAARVAQLLGETDYERVFTYEIGGYPTGADGIHADVWRLAGLAGRHYTQHDLKTTDLRTLAYTESLDHLENALLIARERMTGRGPDQNNPFAAMTLPSAVETHSRRVAARRGFLFEYLSKRVAQLRYSTIAADAFDRIRATVDARMAELAPAAVQQFDSAYANLQSANPEDWANAVHSCRRILEGVADQLFPPTDEPRVRDGKIINLGAKNYRNRLICYAEDHAASETFASVIGSTLSLLIDRLEALFDAANKGTHGDVSRAEADRYVVYTYLVIGDLLSLKPGA